MAAKISDDPLTKQDIENYISQESDFGFELHVIEEIKKLDFNYEHSGSYEDPISQKVREFDIIAWKNIGGLILFFAIECKNLKISFPLIIHCTKRTLAESYNELLVSNSKQFDINNPFPAAASRHRKIYPNSIYRIDEQVGKSTEQIGKKENYSQDRTLSNFISNDSGVFEKISQSINSSYQLILKASKQLPGTTSLILPILVIPNNTLWSIDYKADNQNSWSVSNTNHISYYIGKEWRTKEKVPSQEIIYNISHLEIITIDHLKTFIEELNRTLGFNQ